MLPTFLAGCIGTPRLTVTFTDIIVDVKSTYLDRNRSTTFQNEFSVSSQSKICRLAHLDSMGYNTKAMIKI